MSPSSKAGTYIATDTDAGGAPYVNVGTNNGNYSLQLSHCPTNIGSIE